MSLKNEIQIRIIASMKTREAKRALASLKGDFKSFTSQIAAAKMKILGTTAALVGLGYTLKKGFDFVALGANIEKQRNAFDNLASSVGASGDEILFRLKQVSRGTVDLMSLVGSAARALVLSISPDKLTKLMEISRAASKATGATIQKSFEDIVIGVARQSRLILDNLGLIISIGDANKVYAETLGKTASALTDAEQRVAFMTATLKAGQVIIDRVGKDTLNAADKVDIIKTRFIEAKNAAALFFKELIFPESGRNRIRDLIFQIEELKNSFELGGSAEEHKDRVNKAIEDIEKKVGSLLLKMQGKTEPDSIFKRIQAEAEELDKTLKGFEIVPASEEIGRANTLLQIFDKIEERNISISEAIQASIEKEGARIEQLKEKLEGASISALFTLSSEDIDIEAIERQIQEAEGRLSSLSDRASVSAPFLDFEKQKELFKKVEPEIIAVFHKLDAESQKTFLSMQKRFGDTANALEQAMERAGVKSDAEMQKMAESAMSSFKIIENSGTVTGANLGATWTQLREDILPVLDQMAEDFQNKFSQMEKRFPQLTATAKKSLTEIQQAMEGVSQDMKNSLADFLETGKLDFGSFVGSMRRRLAEFAADQIWTTLGNLIKGVGSGGGGGGGKKGIFGLGGVLGIFHRGGVIGSGNQPTRQLAFAGVPRMHSGGLMPDERLIVGQTEEGMLSRKGMKNLDKLNLGNAEGGGGSGLTVISNVNIMIQAIDTQSGADFIMRPEVAEAVEANIEKAITDNGRIRDAIEQGRK